MKRLLSGLVILLISIIVGIYIFIPAHLTISASENIALSSETAFRFLNNKQQWFNWVDSASFLPHSGPLVHSSYKASGKRFRIEEIQYNAFETSVDASGVTATGRLNLFPLTVDSVALQWELNMPGGSDPFTRVKRYAAAAGIKASMAQQLGAMAAFLNNREKAYKYAFNVTSTTDTLLIAVKSVHEGLPGTAEMYASVNTLQQYALQNGARQTAAPMVNITPGSENKFEMMVALPVNKMLPENGPITYRKLVPGNFLVTEVKGGQATVNNAFEMMQQYILDQRKTIMAIPFQMLITDRSKEPDTSRWVTRLYYPILQ